MANVTRMELFSGVHLTAVHTKKFKSSLIGVELLTPIRAETASANALVPMVLRRGTKRCPDMESLSTALDDLYGGWIEPAVRKKGETQCIGFTGSFLDDAYTMDGSQILEPAAMLFGELLLHPAQAGEGFVPAYVEGERGNLIDRIRAQINEKRQYALNRVTAEMCSGEPFGVDKLGSEAQAAALDGRALWDRYQALLSQAAIEIYFCGSAAPERVKKAFLSALEGLPKTEARFQPSPCTQKAASVPPKLVEEALDVTQGKLTMGLRTDGITVQDPEYPALALCTAVFGGTTTSKLFLNVRERLSLCYYASAQLEKLKGVMLVSSGVEFDKVEEAKAEILAQLEHCKRGQIEDWELEGARRSLVSTLYTTLDSQSRLEDYWLAQIVAGLAETPEALAARIEGVTKEQVIAAAQRLSLDTVYFLKGKED
ncbi:MAG: insulinase family protein [Oscillospiraceae bacterium]|nr:insulinase family protein [Oscillospiraceae bacterium]